MAHQKSVYRSSRAHALPVPVRRHKRSFLRRFIIFTAVVAALIGASYAYLLHVYAPGLQAEARSVPARVNAELAARNAPYVPLSDVSPYLPRAIIAVEDRRFYQHPGIDALGVARAMWVNVTAQHVDQGGSTLEEQLAKRAIVQSTASLHDKARTMALAWAVDQVFSKSQIVELYLNAAYYGQGAYGMGAAAHVYFGTDAAHLTLPQAALLAALPQAPSVYGPHPTAPAVQARKNTVLRDMQSLGYISAAEEHAAENTVLTYAFPNP